MNFKRYFISGLLTLVPVGITWWLLTLILSSITRLGHPLVRALSEDLQNISPWLSALLLEPWFDDLLAFLVAVMGIYLLGWVASRVIGQQMINLMERVIEKVPLASTIYSAIKQLVTVLQTKPDNVERVVMIDFPHREMKVVGLVMRTMTDQATGQELAAVYVPTTPNPTNGYLEVVPTDKLIATDWSMQDAMNFVISGGAVGPDTIPFSNSQKPAGKDQLSPDVV